MKLVKKKCQRCGEVRLVRESRVKCRIPRFGLGSYACWGDLVRVVRKPKPDPLAVSVPAGKGLGWVLSEDAEKQRAEKVREDAAKKLASAREHVSEKTAAMARLAKSLHEWERKAQHYAKRASLTDAEIAAERERGIAAAKTRTERRTKRGLALGRSSP